MIYNETFYEEILKRHLADSTIRVRSFKQGPATAKGDNFLSEMLRVNLKFSGDSITPGTVDDTATETRSFIVKREPVESPELLELVRAQQLFTIEFQVFKDVLPRIERTLGIRLGPKLVYGTDTPPRVVIMEDLSPEGFLVKDRKRGLSAAHATLAIQKLASFHAGSVTIFEENPEFTQRFQQGIFNDSVHPNFYVLAKNSLTQLCDDATTWGHPESAAAAAKLRDTIGSLDKRVRQVYHYRNDEFCVLNHGDAWVNNMLFTEDDAGNPLEMALVDYQMVGFSSPAVDLLYFLGINPAAEVRGDGEELLLETYLDALTMTMKKLRCKISPPTMGQLKEAMYRRRIYAVMSGLFLLPRMMLDKMETESMDDLLKHGTTTFNAYSKPDTIQLMKRILPLFDERGYLDP